MTFRFGLNRKPRANSLPEHTNFHFPIFFLPLVREMPTFFRLNILIQICSKFAEGLGISLSLGVLLFPVNVEVYFRVLRGDETDCRLPGYL